MSEEKPSKKILESSPLSGITVPIAIVLVGALIIFGVTKMLSSGKNHRDLIDEMNSKTFGNRWIAAYELSKFLAGSKIPKEDIPWVIENLSKVYVESVDARTRNFVVLALGSLNNPLTATTLNAALSDQDPQVQFNAVVAIGNMTPGITVSWDKILEFAAQDNDLGLKQVAMLALASHKHEKAQQVALTLSQSAEKTIRYPAGIILIQFQNELALPILNEIFSSKEPAIANSQDLNGLQIEAYKMNALDQIEKSPWIKTLPMVEKVLENETNVRVSTKAKLVLKELKK